MHTKLLFDGSNFHILWNEVLVFEVKIGVKVG